MFFLEPRGIRMTYNEILKRIQPIIAKQLNVELRDVKPSVNISRDLGADSLDALELVMAVEREFNINISGDDTINIFTVDDMVKLVWHNVDPRGAEKYKSGDKSLQTQVRFGVPGYDFLSCGYLPNDKIDDYLKKIRNQDLRQRHCAEYGFSFTGYPSGDGYFKQNLIIESIIENGVCSVYGLNPLCGARGVGGCFRKIKKGECKDQFVIENIGKVFWPDKYAKQR